eukprot:gene12396-biopygen9114
MRCAPAADPMIPLGVPVTCVVFDYSTVVNDITGADGVSGTRSIAGNAISDAMDLLRVHEIERHSDGGASGARTRGRRCSAALRCKSATVVPRIVARPCSGAWATPEGLCAARVGVGRRGSTTSLPPIQVIDTAKVDLSSSGRRSCSGQGSRTRSRP